MFIVIAVCLCLEDAVSEQITKGVVEVKISEVFVAVISREKLLLLVSFSNFYFSEELSESERTESAICIAIIIIERVMIQCSASDERDDATLGFASPKESELSRFSSNEHQISK